MLTWIRSLLFPYLKVIFLLSLLFIGLFYIIIFDDLLELASYGAHPLTLLFFLANQIPLLLSYGIPIASLISALILFSRLSLSHELTALRYSGLSLFSLLAPLICAALLLSAGVTILTSEGATRSHHNNRMLTAKLTELNPFMILNHSSFLKHLGLFFHATPVKHGKEVKDLWIAFHPPGEERMALFHADRGYMNEKQTLSIENSQWIVSQSDGGLQDNLLIENQEKLTVRPQDLARAFESKAISLAPDHLPMSQLRLKLRETTRSDKRSRCISEMLRRTAQGTLTFSVTLVGLCYGISEGRRKRMWPQLMAISLSATMLGGLIMGHKFAAHLPVALICFFLPQLIGISAALTRLLRVKRGVV